jgi:hypothetical protein
MASGNSTGAINPSSISLLPNIILDCIGISLCTIAVCKTLTFILLILIRRQLMKSKEKILYLLSLNMYMSVFIFALFLLDMCVSMLKSHINPDLSQLNYDTLWCRLKVYLLSVALTSSLYSNTIQALYRFFRIIYYTRPFFHRNIYLYIFCILILVILSALQPLPILLIGEYQYEDYHCQIYLTSWRGVLMAAFLTWLLPVTITIIIYAFTLRYIRSNTLRFAALQRIRIKRDVTVMRRIIWLIMFILVLGMPASSITIIYYIFGYIGWWANYLTWLTFISSFIGMSIVQTCYAPHLHALWSRAPNRIHPTAAIRLINLK